MATEFSREFFSANRIVKADLRAARQPREDDITRIKAEVKKLYDATEVLLNITVDESLLSGYVLQIGDRVFDNSGRHALDQMMEGKPSLATLKTRVEDYKPAATSAEGGVVIASADGIVQVDGMDRAVYGDTPILVGIELETGFVHCEGSDELQEELFLYQGLSEAEWENPFLAWRMLTRCSG